MLSLVDMDGHPCRADWQSDTCKTSNGKKLGHARGGGKAPLCGMAWEGHVRESFGRWRGGTRCMKCDGRGAR